MPQKDYFTHEVVETENSNVPKNATILAEEKIPGGVRTYYLMWYRKGSKMRKLVGGWGFYKVDSLPGSKPQDSCFQDGNKVRKLNNG